jgi:hypothetical protein
MKIRRKSREQLIAEDGFSKSVLKALRVRGYTVERIAGMLDPSNQVLHYQLRHKGGARIIKPWDRITYNATYNRPLLPFVTLSKGHVAFVGGFEYFIAANGDLYRASTANPLATNGYRQGARFEATKVSMPAVLKLYGIQIEREA